MWKIIVFIIVSNILNVISEGTRRRGDQIQVWTGSEWQTCNCNGKSNRCFFDRNLWERTGHGGHCLDCLDFTDGPNCEKCRDNYYQSIDGQCHACNCDSTGSSSLQCNSQGQCLCKPGVEGQRCDRCASNFYDFSSMGCKSCGCHIPGSLNNSAACDVYTGQCHCKSNVEGQHCQQCKPGFFDLQMDNQFGCLSCFCFGHSSVCSSSPGYSKYSIDSKFIRDSESWKAVDENGQDIPFQFNSITKNIGVQYAGRNVFFSAPDRYLGDQRGSYNQFLAFSLRIGEESPRATAIDLSLEGAGLRISLPIFGQGNPLPGIRNQQYKFRLHDDFLMGWTPRLKSKDFISILSNLTSIKIKATYGPEGSGFLSDVRLESAQQLPYGSPATWVEMCTCPEGYVGQFCESCSPGYRHDPPGGGSFGECVRCNCNSHAEYCDPDTGTCICKHNTSGTNCERCANGFFGNALRGTENDCEPCPCPDQGECAILPNEQITCLRCPPGYAGHRCDLCVDGFHGDPKASRPCNKCDCNDNVDRNAIGNCNTTTGECLKCVYNTFGTHCEKCLPGYYGDALAKPKGNCRPCGCQPQGTQQSDIPSYSRSLLCDEASGRCNCKPNVMGRQCDSCVEGYWNLMSNEGCESCNCNLIGSHNKTCDVRTGQCYCRPGVTGKKCDECLPLHYGFSPKGCLACECDRVGSTQLECDENGQCPCRPNVEGRRCERCMENKYNKEVGCVDCPVCYTLVQDAVNAHRSKLGELTLLLEEIERNPQVVEDVSFRNQLEEILLRVDDLLREARNAQGADVSLISQLEDLKQRIEKVKDIAIQINGRFDYIKLVVGHGRQNITIAEEIISRAQGALSNARRVLENEGLNALEKARDRSKKFGQQSERMSEIAKLARQLADRHEDEAVTIEGIAKEALNTSEEAYRLAKDAINTQEANRNEINRLRKQLDDTTDLLQRTKKMSDEALKEATKAYNDALEIYTDVNSVSIPDLDAAKKRQDAMDLIEQAKRILKEASDLKEKHDITLNSTNYQIQDARDLLEETVRQGQITDELISDVDAALNKAKEAIQAGENTLADAKKTLITLKEFDQLVQESKIKAEQALGKVAEIRRLIEEAEQKTNDAEDALSGALQDAIEARDVAREAQKIAEKASNDADRIRDEAATTKLRAGTISDQANKLTEDVHQTGLKMKGFEDQAGNDEKLAKEALERANQAKTSSLDASSKVKDAVTTLNGILDALEGLDDIDAGLLEDLERNLADAEQKLKGANLDNRLADLKTARDQQQTWMRNYDDEIEKLKLDVINIAEIKAALPEGCFRRVRLEP